MWVKLDDAFFRNPKVLAAGRDARDFYLVGLCYANAQLTDGAVPTASIRMLTAEADIDDGTVAAQRLVAVGLWLVTPDGYQINDYELYNPSAAQVKAKRAATAERVANWRASHPDSNAGSNAVTSSVSNAVSNAPPVPSPVPHVESLTLETVGSPHMAKPVSQPVAPAKPPRYSPAFETFWRAYPNGNGRAWPKPATYVEWQHLKPDGDLADAILAGETAWTLGRDWQRGFVQRPDRWLKQRAWEEPPEPWSGSDEAAVRAPPVVSSRYSVSHIDAAQAARDFDRTRNGGRANGQHSGTASGVGIVPRQLAAPLPGP